MFKFNLKLACVPLLCAALPFIFALVDPGEICARMEKQSETVRVLVLPFQINAQQDLSYLRNQIADVIGQRLANEGAVTIGPDKLGPGEAMPPAASQSLAQIRRKAGNYNVDQVIWGTFTLIGDTFSLDARLMPAKGDAPPQQFFARGRSLENLITIANKTADRIALKLFHRQVVTDVRIEGNQRIESDAILRVIKTHKGSVFKPETLSGDLRTIYAMGYFDDVRVETEETPKGLTVIFYVKEKPTIRRIIVKGNSYIDEEEIRNNLTISTGAILNYFKIRNNINQIETLYKEKNYHKVHVDYKIEPLENNQADLEFIIEEGPKLYVTRIRFDGNKAFSDNELKDVLEVSEKGFFYWLTSSGDLDRAVLDQDVARLNAFYSNRGYINAKIGEPQVDIQDEGIHITFKIEEGERYKVGKVDVTGDLILPREQIIEQLGITKEAYFSRERVRSDILFLTDLYADRGYAYADISPRIEQNKVKQVVDITFVADKGEQVYFEKIIISGNTKTRDKVIRRELKVNEQGLFSGKALKRSIRNLYRLDYFEDIKVDTLKGSADNKMVLKLDVTEKPTGTFTFGAGYSTEEDVFLTGSIAQRNLFGRGQVLDFSGQIGSRTSRFTLGFTEPRLFDSQYSGSISLYNQERDYDGYTRNSKGGGIGIGYQIADYTYLRFGYRLDQSEISIDRIYDADGNIVPIAVDQTIRDLEGTNLTSSVNLSLTYDSRDRIFNTTDGSKHSIYYEYAGLGGDVGFNKVIGQTMWYIPIYKSLIGFANAKVGFVNENSSDKILPDYEKFYLGGINSLRGFGYQGVAVQDEPYKIGGEEMVQFNLELIFPLLKDAGINGVFFYDTGNVYDGGIDFTDLRQSAGLGIRWLSPIAPIRIEYGFILDRRENEPVGNWEFSLGGSF